MITPKNCQVVFKLVCHVILIAVLSTEYAFFLKFLYRIICLNFQIQTNISNIYTLFEVFMRVDKWSSKYQNKFRLITFPLGTFDKLGVSQDNYI